MAKAKLTVNKTLKKKQTSAGVVIDTNIKSVDLKGENVIKLDDSLVPLCNELSTGIPKSTESVSKRLYSSRDLCVVLKLQSISKQIAEESRQRRQDLEIDRICKVIADHSYISMVSTLMENIRGNSVLQNAVVMQLQSITRNMIANSNYYISQFEPLLKKLEASTTDDELSDIPSQLCCCNSYASIAIISFYLAQIFSLHFTNTATEASVESIEKAFENSLNNLTDTWNKTYEKMLEIIKEKQESKNANKSLTKDLKKRPVSAELQKALDTAASYNEQIKACTSLSGSEVELIKTDDGIYLKVVD